MLVLKVEFSHPDFLKGIKTGMERWCFSYRSFSHPDFLKGIKTYPFHLVYHLLRFPTPIS